MLLLLILLLLVVMTLLLLLGANALEEAIRRAVAAIENLAIFEILIV